MPKRQRTTWLTGVAVATLFVASLGAACSWQEAVPTTLASGVTHGVDLDRLVVAGQPADAAVPAAPEAPSSPPGDAVIAPPPAVFDAPPAPPAPPPPALEAPVRASSAGGSGGTWAVIIGVNDYPGSSSDLRSAINDANDVNLALGGLGVPAENRLVLRDGQATADRIRASVDWLAARAGPDAVAVFFYGGHVRKIGDTTEAMVGADGALVTDRELAGRLESLPARRAWIAIAACYGGGFTEVLAPGRVLTGAADADSLAYESSAFGRSYMVQYMVREAIIDRRAPESVQAAFAYARAELARSHPDRQPVQLDSGAGPLDLRPGAGSPTSTPPPGPSGPPPSPPPSTPPPSTPPPTTCQKFLIVSSCG
ncbi:MAG: caspase family protein [Actinomycetota bacterium]|nr:caspase family protein [Actinomycetota bacterium]